MSASFSQRARQSSIENTSVPIPAEQSRIARKELPSNRSISEDDFNNLCAKLKIEQDKCDELSKLYVDTHNELQRVVKALGSVHSSDAFFFDDNQITNLVKVLRYNIKQWSHQNFPTGTLIKKSFTSYLYQPGNPFSSVAAHPKHYLSPDHGGDLPALIQSYIWSQLVNRVFDSGMWVAGTACLQYGGPEKRSCEVFDHWNGLDKLLLKGERKDPVSYNQWRALTARLVPPQAHGACISDSTRRLVKEIRHELKILPPAENKQIFYEREGEVPTDHDIALETIVISAVSLDRILWQQKAFFRFGALYDRPPPRKFNPDTMNAGLDDEAQRVSGGFDNNTGLSEDFIVELVRAPPLYKEGAQEGGGYGNREVLLKAEVDLVQPPLHPKAALPPNVSITRTLSLKSGEVRGRMAGAFSPP